MRKVMLDCALMHVSRCARLAALALTILLIQSACRGPSVGTSSDSPTFEDLFTLIDSSDLEKLGDSLKSVSNPNGTGQNGETLLYHAIRGKKLDVVVFLLDSNLNIEGRSRNGATPLIIACAEDVATVAKLLLERGADPKAKSGDGRTALHMACQIGNPTLVKMLLAAGAEVNAVTNDGRTPLACAQASLSPNKDEVTALLNAAQH